MRATDPTEKTSQVDDERVIAVEPLPPPEQLIRFFPVAGGPIEGFVAASRDQVRRIVHGIDDRLLVVIGPCSVHDPRSALDYAHRLAEQREQLDDALQIVMRVYFEKPRTTVGWKGLINDPHLDGSFRINEGLRIARSLLIDINAMGVPAGSELLDTSSPQYMADLLSWGAIGARTTESQVHRELASGFSAAIGFKNSTEGNVRVAIDAVIAASQPHSFLGVHKSGQIAMVHTAGNPDGHVILRGGAQPNYDAASVAAACEALADAGRQPSVMVDCSHGNSGKSHDKQRDVVRAVAAQIAAGSRQVGGVMIESHLVAGAQAFKPGTTDRRTLHYGQSITDACIGWDDSAALLGELAAAVRQRRAQRRS
ncbi:MAG TPA: 3-deoxy-7-phosphoheptulonate synthase [Burkholderiaceae bacterium]|nr:3-deoxy-7-phosphoheptulonate synthase [Burkholderiaceae bacterium]